jgi:hypothetical protein
MSKWLAKLGLLAGGALLSLPASALAQIPFGANNVYRVGNDTVYISGDPGSLKNVVITNSQTNRALIASACGAVSINPPTGGALTGTITVGSTPIDTATLATETLPSCVNGAFAEARASNFKTPDGKVVVVNLTPGQAYLAQFNAPRTRRVTLNGCGIGRLRGTTSTPLDASTTFEVDGTSYTVSTLTDATSAPLCRTDRSTGTSTGYVPTSWP